ncbi:MAG: bifunctional 4-hydroxy-2-oxoglutarate aldolase/2-dehydro-3-deoxy-phosphogluconate aldolase [Clostridiales bacterium]|jgi:2-dehydro-3-deoxyphosphogluconate aldolase/(4S)-4-hydroxy-2-oxoglutarate aldolase|nr:bifunctional 4-hydroxy-2-oxoglutarate aldolase/2-dehydro-3-deoxy-phosphogluconate aldolase [Clostridiales bacterium]MBQ1294209.1 bifunctional 4-hydroxy-2-oxoglutarate aldolase/2-dehydro-3-deoxy-phosphogluconate aldolase [Clostridiales bacterium]MBQ1572483.1 bifunctional 4-hydroxy-2-oxoglutarate aldolase/2-dehydro-3-deoxy-phosphogluconate aldolase [Clostridiales bacterium]
MTFSEKVFETGIVPVVVLNNVEDAVPLAGALLKGGIDFMEITFRTECAAECISVISKEVPDMTVGAGTVLNVEQAKLAVDCGAKFIVSPGLDEATVKWAIENDIPVIPGTVTPTEIMKAISLGLKVVKFFPADVYGGIKAIKALSAPFGQVKFLPTGGVSEANLNEFAANKSVIAVGGSWVCKKDDIINHDWEKITMLSENAVKIIKENRT